MAWTVKSAANGKRGHVEATRMLPDDAVWSSSFGNPGEGGFTEYYRTTNGERWVISNGSWMGPAEWKCERLGA